MRKEDLDNLQELWKNVVDAQSKGTVALKRAISVFDGALTDIQRQVNKRNRIARKVLNA